MTGVMPEPAVTKSSFVPARRQHELAGRLLQVHEGARRRAPDQVGAHLAVRDRLDGDRDVAVGAGAVGQGVGPPLAYAVDVDADPDVLARDVAGPVGSGADHDGGGVGRLGLDLDDAPAQVGAAAQRVEEVEVVRGQQRRRGALGQPGRLAQQRPGATAGRGQRCSSVHRDWPMRVRS